MSVLLTAARTESQPAGQAALVDAGRQVFVRECASCHGDAATGYGPASWILKQRPPDLTRFSDRTVPFPTESVRNVITGKIRLEPSHGRSEMPIWRTSLHAAVPAHSVTEIDALLAYLNEIQLRKFGPAEGPTPQMTASAGKTLFEEHCVACHGKGGRGAIRSDYVVGVSTDLTRIASRSAGAFELRRVYESIARHDDDSGESAMPSWSRAFKRAGWGDYLTMKYIEALATYIESIQR